MEAVILTGGASKRMGADKSELEVDGFPLAERIVRQLVERSIPVTVLGPRHIAGCPNIPDEDAFQGPMQALSRFTPSEERCLVVSCDIPGFDAAIVELLESKIGERSASIPCVNGRLQPLCALYATSAWLPLRELAARDERRIMRWIDGLDVTVVDESDLQAAGLTADHVANVNTKEELSGFLQRFAAS